MIYLRPLLIMIGLLVAQQSFSQLPGSGNAYDFNSNYLSVPNVPSLNPNTISLEAWIKADSWDVNSWGNVIISKDGWQNGDAGYTLRAGANGTLSFNLSVNGSWVEVTSAAGAMTTGIWYHVAGVYDGSSMVIFINGEQVNSIPVSGNITQDYYDVNIGKISYTAGGSRFFDGMIDEVRIWDGGIPQSSIQEYMCKKMDASHPNYASLIAHWDMDAVGTITDSSPNGNNGTISGATQVTSGAAIGDESIFNYGGGGLDLTLNWMGIDSVQIQSSSALTTLHLYRVDQTPNTLTAAGGLDSLNSTHYYGVFASSPTAYTYDLIYHYGLTPMTIGNESYLNLAGRTAVNGSPWQYQGATVDEVLNTATKASTSNLEVMLTLACPSINLNVNGTTAHLCGAETLDLFDQAANTNYQWHSGGTPIPGATSNSYTVSSAQNYYLVANDGFCADTSQTILVTQSQNPVVDFGGIAAMFCSNDSDTVFTAATPAGGTYSGLGMTGNTFSPSAAGPGIFYLYYDYTDGNGCSGVDSLETYVWQAPSAPSIVDNGGTLCTSTLGGLTAHWYLDGTLVSSSGVDSCYTPTANGNYTVQVETPDGCTATSTVITVDYVTISELSVLESISIAPNPTSDIVSIQAPENVNFKATISDAQGRELATYPSSASLQIDMSDLSSGVYYVLLTVNETKLMKRIIKE